MKKHPIYEVKLVSLITREVVVVGAEDAVEMAISRTLETTTTITTTRK